MPGDCATYAPLGGEWHFRESRCELFPFKLDGHGEDPDLRARISKDGKKWLRACCSGDW